MSLEALEADATKMKRSEHAKPEERLITGSTQLTVFRCRSFGLIYDNSHLDAPIFLATF